MLRSSLSILSLFLLAVFRASLALDPPKLKVNSEPVGPCQACKLLVQSFKEGLERTSRGKFEGGDAAWEESRLGSYLTSEVRLVEIQEKLCSEVKRGQDQCLTLAENHESFVEDWWFKHQKTDPDLHKWLCIEKLNVCCPDHHYGPNCTPCPGMPDAECSGNGKCKGSGTRKGNGKCVCDKGYKGNLCNSCSTGFFASYQDEKKMLCSECHKSCKDVCAQAGPKGCVACKEGWTMHTELGCADVDECLAESSPCKGNTFCINTLGSFNCLKCDKACNGCNADGPDNCVKCADGYTLKDNICTDARDDSAPEDDTPKEEL